MSDAPETPAASGKPDYRHTVFLGFGMGDVVLLELLKARKLLPQFDAAIDVFVVIEDEARRNDSLKVIQDLRSAGKAVEYSLTPAKGDKQFKRALELKAKQTVRIELVDETLMARVRTLATREEQLVPVANLV